MTAACHPCPFDCPAACRITETETATRLAPAAHHYTLAAGCARAEALRARRHHPERLTAPGLRAPDGTRTPLDWDDALDLLIDRVIAAQAAHGPETIWPVAADQGLGLIQRGALGRVRGLLGWSRQAPPASRQAAWRGWRAGVGLMWGVDITELPAAGHLVVWGHDPATERPGAMALIEHCRQAHGLALTVVDPRTTATARAADRHLAPRPGSGAALARGLGRALIEGNRIDHAFLAEHTDFNDAIAAAWTAAWTVHDPATTGIPATDFDAAVATLDDRLLVWLDDGATTEDEVRAVAGLPVLTGAHRRHGGGGLYRLDDLFALNEPFIHALTEAKPPGRELDPFAITDALDRADPPVAVLLCQGPPPEGLTRRDGLFICVLDDRPHDIADLVLPVTLPGEHDDLHFGHCQTRVWLSPVALTPPGTCRSPHDVWHELGRALGLDQPQIQMGAPTLIAAILRHSGLPGLNTLGQGDLDLYPFRGVPTFRKGFGHPDRRFHFRADEPEVANPLTPGLPCAI